jgi:hypothetical protein
MIIELANHAPQRPTPDGAPAVTQFHVPEWDDGSTHDDAVWSTADGDVRLGDLPGRVLPEGAELVKPGPQLGGYTHDPGGISVPDFKEHLFDAIMNRDGITHLPDHEILLAVAQGWPKESREKPAWVHVVEHDLTPAGHADDLTAWLQEYWGTDAERPANFEQIYHTVRGGPGEDGPLLLPKIENTIVNDGRSIANINDGGGALGQIGVGTAATGTTLTTTSTLVTNALAGQRIVVYSTTSNNLVWGNVISNTNAAGASVITVDRWYVFATPGGSAATTPTTPWAWAVLDGGMVSAWFIGLTTSATAPAATDHVLNGPEYTTAGGGFVRKISPYAQTSGTSPRALTLTPVFTGNGSDTYPSTFAVMGAFVSMVVGFGGAGGPLKYSSAMNATATVAASGDQLTLTETINGS